MRNKSWFKKGHVPWNKNVKGIHLSPETEFNSSVYGKAHPSWKGGVQKMTKDCYYHWTGPNKRKRRPRVMWEKYHGSIPEGHVIWHINGDNTDDRLENLECITRGEMMKRNKKGTKR